MLCLTSWGPGCLEDVWWPAPEYRSQLWFNQRHLGHWKEIHAALRRAHESSLTFFWHATRPFNQFPGFIWLRKLSSLSGPKHPIGEHYFWDKWENCPLVCTRGWHAGILLILRFHFGKSSINLFSQSDYIKGVFLTTSVSMQQCHNSCSESLWRTPPSTQLRTTQRTLKRTLSENSKERL